MEDLDPALVEGEPATLLANAQRMLDEERPFQAHEILEAGWKRAPEAERPLWRALAQLAVGVTHALRGNGPGAIAIASRAAREFEGWDARSAPHGIDVAGLAVTARQLAKTQQPQAIRLLGAHH
jgi:predicted metal-dependent hydrolase